MKREFKNFIGIDISKDTLDMALVVEGKVIFHQQVNNTGKAVNSFMGSLKKSYNVSFQDTVFCMEFTGIYGYRAIDYLVNKKASIWLESGTHMKRSMGMVRGKNDALDSKRIADFAFTHVHQVKMYTPAREVVKQLKVLMGERTRYMKCKKQIACAIKEQKQFLDTSILKESGKRSTLLIKQLDRQIKNTEDQVKAIIARDKELTKLYALVTSVDGVGPVTAMELIITSEEFLKISDPKKYACYGGVVPFEHSSGTSVRGKARVSHMANKKVKTTLHMAALSAIKMEGDIRDYYLRKIEEGKHKMSVINAVRNKIVKRVFACVKENRMFEKKYNYCLVNP
jgi:transposase